MSELRRRAALVRALWAASKGRRRDVALYRDFGDSPPLAAGPLRWLGLRAVRVGSTRVSWSAIERVEASPNARCQNCLHEHGPLDACFIGVIAGVVLMREARKTIAPELLAQVNVDEMWDRYGGPAADWLEGHLRWLEANDAV